MATKRSATSKLFWIIGILLLLTIVAATIASRSGVFGNRQSGLEVEVTEAGIRSITQIVTASGRVQPEVEVKISPDVSGEIVDLRVREGDVVERGELLVRIKQDDYLAQVEQSKAGVLQAKAAEAQRLADFLSAQLEHQRQQGLFDAGAISEADVQLAKTKYDVAVAAQNAAKYSVQSAEARLRETQDQLNKTTIYAPMTGTVSMLAVEAGERVVGTSQMQGTEMMRIALLDQMELEVDVNENDVINVAVGDSASIQIDAYPERVFLGEVTEIANSARVTGQGTQQQITNFPVKVRVVDTRKAESQRGVSTAEVAAPPTETPQLRPGMSGTVDVFTRTVEDVVAVPIQAVTVRDVARLERDSKDGAEEDGAVADSTNVSTGMGMPEEDLRKVVFIVEDDKAKLVEVETGIADDSHIQIVSGLSGGEQVVVGPYRVVSRTLQPDAAVRTKPMGAAIASSETPN
jgi:HlyD family secretion protein